MNSQFKYPDRRSCIIPGSVISLELRSLAQSLVIHRGTSRAFPTVVQHETPRGSWIWRNVRKTGSWRCWAAGGIDPSDPDLCGTFSYVWTPVKTPQNTRGSSHYVHICLSSCLHICHSAHFRALSLCCYSLNNWGQRASPLDAGKPGPCVSDGSHLGVCAKINIWTPLVGPEWSPGQMLIVITLEKLSEWSKPRRIYNINTGRPRRKTQIRSHLLK